MLPSHDRRTQRPLRRVQYRREEPYSSDTTTSRASGFPDLAPAASSTT